MPSFINHKYGDTTTESILEKEQHSVIHFLCAKGLSQMPFTLRYVQYMVTSVLQDQQYKFGVKSLPVDEKALLMKKTWPMCCFDD